MFFIETKILTSNMQPNLFMLRISEHILFLQLNTDCVIFVLTKQQNVLF